MDNLEILTRAIKMQKPISFDYYAPEHAIGKRYGNPHAIFIHPTTNNVNIDVWKTSGVSTDATKPLPAWRQYRLEFIRHISILEAEESFTIARGYNPTSRQYSRVIVKI
jgi:hypothetical protein